MPEVMECINGYRDGNVKLSIKRDGSAVPAGALDFFSEYGYFKVADLAQQLDLSTEPLGTWVQRFLKTFINLDLNLKAHVSMLYANNNLTYNLRSDDIQVIHQCLGKATMWIKTLNDGFHQLELTEGELLVVTPEVKVYRRKPNFFSRWADKFSTAEINYIQNILQYGQNLSD